MTYLKMPLTLEKIKNIKAGSQIFLSGTIFSMRDKAHKKMVEENFYPLNLKNQIIFYMGPSPTRPGRKSGSCGPTTSARMDKWTPTFIKKTGIIGIIGKGERCQEVKAAMKGKVIYLLAFGGLGAFYAKCVKKSEIVLFKELGCEAVYKLEVENMPLIVAQDIKGESIL
ncbi:MAG: fumarate hydratase C-terminal domain-containing protein [Elusimicrobiaceae bacterium]|nr:fumarate hydratase C-terminal domain-containing protein [Elusimicrobiaceae bacterium]MBQ6224591.1 fumarate hydratase C-terminal domain-containing protein [Campylobacter sp.]